MKSFATDSLFRKLSYQAFVSLIMRCFSAVSGLLTLLFVSRNFGAEVSSIFYIGVSLTLFLSAVCRLGFDNVLVKYTARLYTVGNFDGLRLVFLRTFFIVIAVSIGFTVLGLVVLYFAFLEYYFVLQYFIFSVVFFVILNYVAFLYQGVGRFSLSVFFLNVCHNLFFVTMFVLFEIETVVDASRVYFFSIALSSFAAGFSIIFFFKNIALGRKIDESYSFKLSGFIAVAKSLFFVVLVTQLTLWFGQWAASYFLDKSSVSIFAAAQRVSLLVSFVLAAVNYIVAPKFSIMYQNGDVDALKRLFRTSIVLMCLASMPFFILVIGFPGFVLSFFGEGFANGANLLRILALGQLVNVLTGSVGFLLTMTDNERYLRSSVFVSFLFNILATLIFTPAFGVLGIAAATAIAVAGQNLIASYYVKQRLGFSIFK